MEIVKNKAVRTYKCPMCGSSQVIRHREVVECDEIEKINIFAPVEAGSDFEIEISEDTEYGDTDKPNSYSCGDCGNTIFIGNEDDFVKHITALMFKDKNKKVKKWLN